jgi:hypothetical protein
VSKQHEVLKVQKAMLAIHDSRDKLAKEVMAGLGNGDNLAGINLDTLTKFAREVIKLNKEFEMLSAQHKKLMGY